MDAKDLIEGVSLVCVGVSTFVSLKVAISFERMTTALVQLELRMTKAIDEASGKQSGFVEQARRAATTSIQRSKENRTAIGILDGKVRDQKNCLDLLEARMDRASIAR